MQTFNRDQIQTHCVGADWPDFLGEVQLGQSFIIETEQFNLVNGPLAVAVVREAYRAMREVVAARIGGSIEAANPIVATALDIRNCAIYGLGNYIQKAGKTAQPDQDLAIVAYLPKDIFVSWR